MASYQPVTKEIVEQLEKIAPGRVYFGDDVNPDYGRDEMPIYGTRVPEASVDAMTTEEIAAVMKLCYENNIPVTTRGAGTGLVGGCVPVMGGVVIATTKMNKILGYDEENFTVTVRNLKVSAGAGFIVALTGDIMTMPGLPKVPAAEKIAVDENGVITGLF